MTKKKSTIILAISDRTDLPKLKEIINLHVNEKSDFSVTENRDGSGILTIDMDDVEELVHELKSKKFNFEVFNTKDQTEDKLPESSTLMSNISSTLEFTGSNLISYNFSTRSNFLGILYGIVLNCSTVPHVLTSGTEQGVEGEITYLDNLVHKETVDQAIQKANELAIDKANEAKSTHPLPECANPCSPVYVIILGPAVTNFMSTTNDWTDVTADVAWSLAAQCVHHPDGDEEDDDTSSGSSTGSNPSTPIQPVPCPNPTKTGTSNSDPWDLTGITRQAVTSAFQIATQELTTQALESANEKAKEATEKLEPCSPMCPNARNLIKITIFDAKPHLEFTRGPWNQSLGRYEVRGDGGVGVKWKVERVCN